MANCRNCGQSGLIWNRARSGSFFLTNSANPRDFHSNTCGRTPASTPAPQSQPSRAQQPMRGTDHAPRVNTSTTKPASGAKLGMTPSEFGAIFAALTDAQKPTPAPAEPAPVLKSELTASIEAAGIERLPAQVNETTIVELYRIASQTDDIAAARAAQQALADLFSGKPPVSTPSPEVPGFAKPGNILNLRDAS